jgi:hypothetical protein
LSPYAIVGVAVNGTKIVQGVSATVFTRTDPTVASGGSDQYFYVNAGGVTLLGNNDATDSITPLIVPYVELLFPVQVGSVSSLSGTNLAFGKDKSGNSITLNLTQTIANVAIESVDVPAGTFANAMHQTTKVAGTAFDSAQSTPAISGTDDIWLVPGIGQGTDRRKWRRDSGEQRLGAARVHSQRQATWIRPSIVYYTNLSDRQLLGWTDFLRAYQRGF